MPAVLTRDRGAPTPRPQPRLQVGSLSAAPYVLAPMAGITNLAFRRLCRQFGRSQGQPHDGPPLEGLYVSEMVSARALVAGNRKTLHLLEHDPDEHPRSVQLYAVDPATARAAARILVQQDRADHIDLNFGCPVPKVTRTGGGAALPWKRELFRSLVGAVVAEAGRRDVPVTVKMRLGIDRTCLTYLDAGWLAEAEGAAAVALHARTADQAYSGEADWSRIRALKRQVSSIPVLGNGDIWSADDALRMVEQTGCDGVIVGRGCLGRPWLFADLAAAFAGLPIRQAPALGEVAGTLQRHAAYLVDVDGDEARACRDLRKHVGWYLKGFPVGALVRGQLARVESLAQLDELLRLLDPAVPWPGEPAEGPRGRAGTPKRVALPDGWLCSPELTQQQRRTLLEAESAVSGG